jgi:hypothetical protein
LSDKKKPYFDHIFQNPDIFKNKLASAMVSVKADNGARRVHFENQDVPIIGITIFKMNLT